MGCHFSIIRSFARPPPQLDHSIRRVAKKMRAPFGNSFLEGEVEKEKALVSQYPCKTYEAYTRDLLWDLTLVKDAHTALGLVFRLREVQGGSRLRHLSISQTKYLQHAYVFNSFLFSPVSLSLINVTKTECDLMIQRKVHQFYRIKKFLIFYIFITLEK